MQHLRDTVPPKQLAAASLDANRTRVDRSPEMYRLRYELYALALQKPDLLAGVKELFSAIRGGIAASVRQATGDTGIDADALAAVLLACFDGLALQKLADPDFDLDAAYSALLDLLELVQMKGNKHHD